MVPCYKSYVEKKNSWEKSIFPPRTYVQTFIAELSYKETVSQCLN